MRAAGWLVEAVPNGEAALFVAAVLAPDAIILDLRPPVVSGLEAIRRLKRDEDTKHIPVVAISALAPSVGEEARVAGCDEFVAKPLDPESLPDLLEALLAG